VHCVHDDAVPLAKDEHPNQSSNCAARRLIVAIVSARIFGASPGLLISEWVRVICHDRSGGAVALRDRGASLPRSVVFDQASALPSKRFLLVYPCAAAFSVVVGDASTDCPSPDTALQRQSAAARVPRHQRAVVLA
jgi:hypothetical protein